MIIPINGLYNGVDTAMYYYLQNQGPCRLSNECVDNVQIYPVSDLVSIYSIYRTALTTGPRVAWDRATLWGGSWLADRHDMPSTSGALTLHVTITLHATITALYRHGITCFNWQYSDARAFIKLDHTNPIIIIPFSQFITGLDVLHIIIIFYSD